MTTLRNGLLSSDSLTGKGASLSFVCLFYTLVEPMLSVWSLLLTSPLLLPQFTHLPHSEAHRIFLTGDVLRWPKWPPQSRHSPRAIFSFVWKMRVLVWMVLGVWLLRSSIWDWTGSPQEAMEEMMRLAAVDHPSKKFGVWMGLVSLVSSRWSRSYRGTSLKNERQVIYFTMALIF